MSLIILDENPRQAAIQLPDFLIASQFKESVRVLYYSIPAYFPGAMNDPGEYYDLGVRYIDSVDRLDHNNRDKRTVGTLNIRAWVSGATPNLNWLVNYAKQLSAEYIGRLITPDIDCIDNTEGGYLLMESLSESHALLHGLLNSVVMDQVDGRIKSFVDNHADGELYQILDFPMGWCCHTTFKIFETAFDLNARNPTDFPKCKESSRSLPLMIQRHLQNFRNILVNSIGCLPEDRMDIQAIKSRMFIETNNVKNADLVHWLSRGSYGEDYLDGAYYHIPFLIVRALIDQQNWMVQAGYDPNTKARDGAQTPYMAGNVLWNVAVSRVSMVLAYENKRELFGRWNSDHRCGRYGIYKRNFAPHDPWGFKSRINGGVTFPEWFRNIHDDAVSINADLLRVETPSMIAKRITPINETQRIVSYAKASYEHTQLRKRYPMMGEYLVEKHGLYDSSTPGHEPWERLR